MKKDIKSNTYLRVIFVISLSLLLGISNNFAQSDEELTELEEFIAEESGVEDSGTMDPTSRPVDSVYGSMNVLDIPRSVTVLTPEMMKQFNITDYHDLDKIGAGMQRVNYYGLPGTPFMRGDLSGTFFNGMLRAYNRNDMPVSFGSMEALDVVKGPAPAHFSPTQAGGYVNQVPKSPYFDKFRGSVKAEVGFYEHFKFQTDIGGPLVFAGKPAAYRISLTAQQSGSYYDDLNNDFISIYASMKMKLKDDVKIFFGGEYFNFNSNENPGWNRITQDLINNGNYIIGEPRDATSALWDNTFPKIDTPFIPVFNITNHSLRENFDPIFDPIVDPEGPNPYFNSALVVPRDLVDGSGQSAEVIALLEDLDEEGYAYTQNYLNAGGTVFTKNIDGKTVLTDPADVADSEDLLIFFDYENTRNPDLVIKNKFLLEYLTTYKVSSYGYSFAIDQLVIEDKVTFEFNLGDNNDIVLGTSVRYLNAKQLQDFDAEPFARRDITRREISANSKLKTGPQRNVVPPIPFGPTPDVELGFCPEEGCNLWASNLSANSDSKMIQAGVFGFSTSRIGDNIIWINSLRGEFASWEAGVPNEIERSGSRGETLNDDNTFYWMASTSPVFHVAKGVSLYASAQLGTAFNSTQGGAVTAAISETDGVFNNDQNFADSELYEAGVKIQGLNKTLFMTFAGYHWDKTRIDSRSGEAAKIRSKGFEAELTWSPNEVFTLIASATASRTNRREPAGFRFADTDNGYWLPLWAGGLFVHFGGEGSNGRPANNPNLILNGFPEVSANIYGSFRFENGWGFGVGAHWRDSYYHNWDRNLVLPSTVSMRANVSFSREKWDVLLTIENLTNEDVFYGADPIFGANSLLLKAPDINGKVAFTYKF